MMPTISSRWAICFAMLATGCWWQRDAYTDHVKQAMDNWSREQELAGLLGDPFVDAEFGLFIRPPKPAVAVQKPEGLLGLFQGGDTRDPPLEVVIVGNSAPGSLQEFISSAFAKLSDAGKGPSTTPQPNPENPNPVVDFLYGSQPSQTRFDLYVASGERTVGAPGAGNRPVAYQWLIYFTEDPPQQVMIAFLIPDAKYAQYTQGLLRSLESLALGSKVGVARAGILAPLPGAAPGRPPGGS